LKQANYNIEGVLKEVLNQHPQTKSFESIWNVYKNNLSNKGRKKRQVAIIVFALVALLVMGAGILRKIDNTNYPFINDPQVIGKWESVDFVQNIDDFNPNKKSPDEKLYLTALAFINDGKMLFATDNGGLTYSSFTWTKDKVLNKQERTASNYIIKEINGSTYMFFEWKSGDYIFRNMTPSYYVLKKVDNKDYSNYQVEQIVQDKIDYPFVDDTQMIGKWESVDFVKTIDSFKPGIISWQDDFYITGLKIKENGQLTITTTNGESSSSLTWTKGLIINRGNKTASKCEVKEINGTTYMFYEWKSGDYTYRGIAPWYYVLKKIQ
jgi:bla regulator protein BlaR1